jgi:hypothetical protein
VTTPDSDTGIAAALRTQDTFNREQVAWLMSQAARWGYENRVDEENANWPPEPVMTFGRWADQTDARSHADQAARVPRTGDHRGGPVDWETGAALQEAA